MKPYLSIIIAARNDAHGGPFMQRLRTCLQTLYALCKKYPVPLEIILVEWNPPPQRAPLHTCLPPLPANIPLQLRVVRVPAYIHQQYHTHKLLSMYQMIAKNVGIRRAQGTFVLCTNADIIFSEQLFSFLAKRHLVRNKFYRCNRCDIPPLPTDVQKTANLQAILTFCAQNIQQRLGKNRWYANFPGSSPFWYRYLPMQLMTIVLSQLLWVFISPIYNCYHSLDTWACGDFTLMHKQDWMDIKGYAELDAYSLHVDSLALGAAAAMGKKQHILPLSHCTYHVSHTAGWEFSTPIERMAFDLRMPKMDGSTLQEVLLYMLQKRKPVPFNTDDWGHAGTDFEEYSLKPIKPDTKKKTHTHAQIKCLAAMR